MWYVVRVAIDQEEQMFPKIERVICNICPAEVFVPRYVRMRKFKGEWKTDMPVLFAGYVFVDMEEKDAEAVKRALYIFTGLVEPVCIGGGFHPIRESEQFFLESMMDGEHNIGFSVGNILDGNLVVDRGPLMGKAQYVCRIDRHHRRADVKLALWGEEYRMRVGLEVKSKTGTEKQESEGNVAERL